MTDDYTIRPFEPGDLPALHQIRIAAFAPVFRSFREIVGKEIAPIAIAADERSQADYLDAICRADASQEMYVVERGSHIVAFCALSMNEKTSIGEVDLNAVHPDHQGNGIGTWMYRYVLDRMKRAGMRVATVGTGGDASHASARRAYEKAGFGPSIPSVYYYRTL
ncbi:MAG: GNAT family N-acetyltransferase [Pseudomonadota bacterium]